MKTGIFDEQESGFGLPNLNPITQLSNFNLNDYISPIDLGEIVKLPTIKTEIVTDTSLGIKILLGFIGIGFFLNYIKK